MLTILFIFVELTLLSLLTWFVVSTYALTFHGGMAPWLFKTLYARIAATREPDVIITDANPDTEDGVHIRRWFVIPRNRFLNIYLHNIRGDDHSAPHDHPWWSISYMLKGYLCEHTPDGSKKWITEGQIRIRSPKYAHRLTTNSRLHIDRPAWTIFITGPVVRPWGFHCPQGWVHRDEYISRRDRGENGCGEE
jgi:hypothetical protein